MNEQLQYRVYKYNKNNYNNIEKEIQINNQKTTIKE